MLGLGPYTRTIFICELWIGNAALSECEASKFKNIAYNILNDFAT